MLRSQNHTVPLLIPQDTETCTIAHAFHSDAGLETGTGALGPYLGIGEGADPAWFLLNIKPAGLHQLHTLI